MQAIEAFDKKFNPKRRRCPRCNSANFSKELPKFIVKDKVLTGFLPNKFGRHCGACGLCFKFRANGEIVQIKEVSKDIRIGG
jgi:transcription elongation factor Elf1